jgi:hypothetical protein
VTTGSNPDSRRRAGAAAPTALKTSRRPPAQMHGRSEQGYQWGTQVAYMLGVREPAPSFSASVVCS